MQILVSRIPLAILRAHGVPAEIVTKLESSLGPAFPCGVHDAASAAVWLAGQLVEAVGAEETATPSDAVLQALCLAMSLVVADRAPQRARAQTQTLGGESLQSLRALQGGRA